jgi:hypothetical protein
LNQAGNGKKMVKKRANFGKITVQKGLKNSQFPEKTEPKLNHPELSSSAHNELRTMNSELSSLPDQELEKLNKLLRRIDHAKAKIDRRAS